MIPLTALTEWNQIAPWPQPVQVEQDLVLSRILVEVFADDFLRERLAFRGGTAIHKLFLTPAHRYSEDIDLVQVLAGQPIGPILDRLRGILAPWLGAPRSEVKDQGAKLIFTFAPEQPPPAAKRVKLEINTREQFTVHGYVLRPFEVRSRWFAGSTQVRTYELEELLATKLRALYRRKKGRDLYDLVAALRATSLSVDRLLAAFHGYLQAGNLRISRAQFEENLHQKRSDSRFLADIQPILTAAATWNAEEAFDLLASEIIVRLPGDPWRGP